MIRYRTAKKMAIEGNGLMEPRSESDSSTRQDTLEPLVPVATAVGSFWLRRTAFIQILLLAVVLLIKNGFDIELRNIQDAYLPGSLTFPDPVGYFSASFGQVIFVNALGLSTTALWVGAHILLTVFVLVVAAWFVIRNGSVNRSYLLVVLASATSVSAVMLSIGKYDIFTFAGGVILVLARSNWLAGVGALVLASGNPEQAILASLSLLVLSQASSFRQFRARSIIALSVSILSWIVVQIWFISAGLDLGRVSLIPDFLGESLSNILTAPLQEIWAWLGVGWFIVIPAIILIKGRERLILIAGVIVIPALATIITADGARVFGAIVLPTFLVVGIWLASHKIEPSRYARSILGFFIILLVLLPTTLDKPGWFDGQVRGQVMSVTEQIFG